MIVSTRRPTDSKTPRWLVELVDAIAGNFEALKRLGFGDGVVVRELSFTATVAQQVPHTLGRKPRGWRVTRSRTACARLYESATVEPTDKTITLTSETTCVADVEFW